MSPNFMKFAVTRTLNSEHVCRGIKFKYGRGVNCCNT